MMIIPMTMITVIIMAIIITIITLIMITTIFHFIFFFTTISCYCEDATLLNVIMV